jgi:5-methylcytosine-specific restriction endonuclease McrA
MTLPTLPPALRYLVFERARQRCEYCLIHEGVSIYSHEVDHIIALKHGGQTQADNLAVACLPCNRAKGSDLTTFDPLSNALVPLFNPRQHTWSGHFILEEASIVGLTPIGRATVVLLKLNVPTRLLHRRALIAQGRYP